MKQSVLCIAMVVLQIQASAQPASEVAYNHAMKALQLEEEGKFDEAIDLLREAEKLDPENLSYPYEEAYVWYVQKQYKKASEILEPLTRHRDTNDQVFQLLGNSYDNMGESEKAIATYEAGLEKFPKSGKLFLELGILFMTDGEFEKAIGYYEKGVQAEPMFASNYYWLSRLFLNSENEVWGMIYGEIFMNLERNSKRTAELSKLLYDTYQNEIEFTSDTTVSVSFCKSAYVNVNGFNITSQTELPFGLLVYEPLLSTSAAMQKTIDLNTLHDIRKSFLDIYYQRNFNVDYPIVLFDFQKRIANAGHLEAYDHWLLMKGDEEMFEAWRLEHAVAFDSFISWFRANSIEIEPENVFLSIK